MTMNTQTHFPRTKAGVEAGLISTLPAVRPTAPKPLSKAEQLDLTECEVKIHSGLEQISKSWREIARQWCHIRDERLYRAEFPSMEAYTQARFGKSAARLRQLIRGEGVMQNLELAAPDITDLARPRMLPKNEAQVRELSPLPNEAQPAAWSKAQELAGAGRQPTAKQVRAAVEGQKVWPVPGEHGYYSRKGAEVLTFDHKDATAELVLLQISRDQWVWGTGWHFGTGSMEYHSTSLRAPTNHSELAESRDQALRLAAGVMRDKARTIVRAQDSVVAKSQRSVAQKMMDWAYRFFDGKPKEAAPAAGGQWVICRPAMKGATSPSAMIARYSGPGWGWSPNPEKGKPFTNKQTALTEAARHGDEVVSLEEALRPAVAAQARARERLVMEDGPETQALVDAKFRVIDAEVELGCALALINQAGGELRQEMYHAEKARDHLGCLKALLTGGGLKKGKR